jgi:hypothetical protein
MVFFYRFDYRKHMSPDFQDFYKHDNINPVVEYYLNYHRNQLFQDDIKELT